MNFGKLLKDKKIEKVEKEEFDALLAEKDIYSAKHSFDAEDYNWALSIFYNAVLRAGRSFMFYLGYRPIGKEHHKNVFEFLRESEFKAERNPQLLSCGHSFAPPTSAPLPRLLPDGD